MNNDLQKRLDELKKEYTSKLPAKFSKLEKDWKSLQSNFTKNDFSDFYREVHSLTGSCGTYGFTQLSDALRHLEVYLRKLQPTAALNDSQQSDVSQLLDDVKNIYKNKM